MALYTIAIKGFTVANTKYMYTATTEMCQLYSRTNGDSHATGARAQMWITISDNIIPGLDPAWTIIKFDQGAIIGILLQNEPESDKSNEKNFISELLVYSYYKINNGYQCHLFFR